MRESPSLNRLESTKCSHLKTVATKPFNFIDATFTFLVDPVIEQKQFRIMGLIDYLGDNAAQIDPMEYENKVREKDPRLLQSDEDIVFAFKGRGGKGRDHYMLTTKRVLIRDKKGVNSKRVSAQAIGHWQISNPRYFTGMTGKQIEYTSVPYKSILAFSVETAGSIDTDQELKLYAQGIGKVSFDLVKSIDVMPIYRFLNTAIIKGKMAGKDADGAVVFDSSAQLVGGSTGFFDILGSNYAQIDSKMVESSLKSNVLLDDEKVELAFKCGRDSFILTSRRLLKIDVKGITGKKGDSNM